MGKRLTIALAIFTLIVVPIAMYVAGYIWLGTRADSPQGDLTDRYYEQKWAHDIFQPAGWLEERIRGVRVRVTWTNGDPALPQPPSSQ